MSKKILSIEPSKEMVEAVLGKGKGADGNIQLKENTLHYSNVTHMTSMPVCSFIEECEKYFFRKGYNLFFKKISSSEKADEWTTSAFIESVKDKEVESIFANLESKIEGCILAWEMILLKVKCGSK